MPTLPLTLCWFAVMSVYLPYSMGLAFLNPVLLTGYGLLGFLVGGRLERVRAGFAVTAGTLVLGLAVVNITGGWPELVLPAAGMLGAVMLLAFNSTLAAVGLRRWMERRGCTAEEAAFRLSAAFGGVAVAFYFNGALPLEIKTWLAAHTTSSDLRLFCLLVSLLFVGIWRMTQ
ncbi:MAG: hypothetical protein K7J46_20100 [Bryobacter sp.]|nr:hypothetical protein [Bryobacter sp. CoA8 C33]